MAETLRQSLENRLTALKAVRTDYEEEWQQIARFAQPSRSRFLRSEKDKGTKRRIRNRALLDPHGIEAFRTLTNGMTSGLTSASRPWFTLTTGDERLMEEEGVRGWLSEVERMMYAWLAQSNFYAAVKSGYGEMGLFGTEACVMVEDQTLGTVSHALTCGEYWIACSPQMVPDTLYREIPLTVRQTVMEYREATPDYIRKLYDSGSYQETVTLYEAIEPNTDHDPRRFGSKPWRRVVWDCKDKGDRTIRQGGTYEQPFWAPRWDVIGGDTYGVSPGMDALPALRELQMQAKRRNEAIDRMVKPEMVVPNSVRLTGEPGRMATASATKDQVFPAYNIPYQAVDAVGQEIIKCREQVDGLSYADLFNAITNMRGVQPRNVEEIAARNEEKLTQLGPVIERVNNEKLRIIVDRVFGIMSRGGMLPPVPESIAEAKIDVEFVSILQQMQRMVGIGQIERTAGFVGNLAAAMPDALDKLNVDEMVDEYAYRAGAPAKIIRSAAEVEQIRKGRAQQQQMMQTAAMMPAVQQGADAAQLLSQTDVGGGETLMDRLLPA